MLKTALEYEGPIAVRYPRGAASGVSMEPDIRPVEIGKGKLLREGNDLAIIAIGNRVWPSVEAAKELERENIRAAVVNSRFVKPLDKELIIHMAHQCNRLVTVEENALQGGFGSAVLELLAEEGITGVRVVRLGVGDQFIDHGSQQMQRCVCSIDTAGIVQAVRSMVAPVAIRHAASRH
jgi:1-deoxy-D-xylulose-5-phosphate synthase